LVFSPSDFQRSSPSHFLTFSRDLQLFASKLDANLVGFIHLGGRGLIRQPLQSHLESDVAWAAPGRCGPALLEKQLMDGHAHFGASEFAEPPAVPSFFQSIRCLCAKQFLTQW